MMRMVDLIHKKRDGGTWTADEIRQAIQGYVKGDIPDYQMSAWAMSIFFRGMTAEETAALTMEIVQSGDQIDLSSIHGVKVDKHSTGGVGDTTTLVLGPLVAAAGIPVAKMSGRGLGHTGGTIDKLEAINGFHVELTREQFIEQVNRIGLAVISQSGNITPADKKLYALRDVTATVDSIPLIASSIMSKKIAAGSDAILLDVKTGAGAFMKTLEKSIELARAMVDIGTQVGRKTSAMISNMDQPLGFAIGNSLEVREAIDTLRGQGPADLEELCIVGGAYMCLLADRVQSVEEGMELIRKQIESGAAMEKLKAMIKAQGGDASLIDEPERLPVASIQEPMLAARDGFVSAIEAESIGVAAMRLGAGRATKESAIDFAAGILLKKKVGDAVCKGEALAILHTNQKEELEEVKQLVSKAFTIIDSPVPSPKLIYATVTPEGTTYL